MDSHFFLDLQQSHNMAVAKRKKAIIRNMKKAQAIKPEREVILSNTRKPEKLSENEWQTLLRIQIAKKEKFEIKNLGKQPVYSDYAVFSTKSNNTYKVAIRSRDNSLNFCSCLDFKTNGLGTCKHIEAVRNSLQRKKSIKRLLEQTPDLPYSSIYVSYMGDRKIKLRIGTDQQTAFKKWARKYFDADGTMLPSAHMKMEVLLQEAHKISKTFRCYDDAIAFIVEQRDTIKRETVTKNADSQLFKELIKVELFPYQKEGVLFAAKAGRAILADDMGLGKTVQAIAWAQFLHKHIGTQKVVIVCPTSLKYQWKTEIEKFCDGPVTVIEGNVLARKSIYENDKSYFLIVSYHMAGNDWQYINQMRPDAIILDEAQRIKNWRAKISQNIKRLRSPYALILTGTPLENNIEELYSLVQYVNPFLLGSLYQFLSGHQVKDPDTGKVTGYTGLNNIGKQLKAILLRRTKKEVLKQLPERMDKNLFVPMTNQQLDVHTELANGVASMVTKWKRFGFLNEQDRQRLMNSLNMMRMVCDSTYILDQQTNFQTKLDELFNILDELLEMKEEKIVVFSQWERMTRLVAVELQRRKIKFENLHGGIHSKKREALFTNFNNDPECRIFLSTDAGGVGLNLQTASYLINLDIPWNPAVLEQRIGRIYRMGQQKNVSIINLVAQDTIEHRMLSTLKFKSSVAAGILDNGEDSIFLGDDKFKQFMQSVESITQLPDDKSIVSFDEDEKQEIALIDNDQENIKEIETNIVEEEIVQEPLYQVEPPVDMVSSDSLVNTGMAFFSQLINTLNDQQSIKQLVSSITEKDEKTGRTWLKLPVQNEETVEKALHLVAGLLKGLSK